MSKKSDVLNKIIEILQTENKDRLNIVPATHLQNDLHLDSLGAIRLIALLEAEFDIIFEFTDHPPKTVEDLAQFVESHFREET